MDNAQSKLTIRGRIVGMKESGLSAAEIARQVGVSLTTVYKWCNRWEAEGDLRDRPRSGAPRRTTPAEDQQILEEVAENPFTNARAVREELDIEVSDRTVRKRLHAAGIHHRRPAIKEKLTDLHRANRLRFAQRYAGEDLDFWGKVIFSDEKTFASTTHGQLHCWRPNDTRYSRQNIYEVARSGHVTCNVWGWIHLYGLGELAEIEGRFTADKYLEILEEVMVPSVRAMALPFPERILFMQVRFLFVGKDTIVSLPRRG